MNPFRANLNRVALFLGTNFAILFVLNIVMNLFGVSHYLETGQTGINVTGVFVLSFAFGMGGALVSLAMSKSMAKRSMGVRLIDQPAGARERRLLDIVAAQARAAGIGMPEVGVFPDPRPNAFATGASRNKSLVAVSEGLLAHMRDDEVEAVLGHEISHVANGDMVTLALIQGVVNTFVLFLARIIGHVVDRAVFRSAHGYGPGYWITTILMQVVLSILASIVVMWFSRYREFRADAGGARLAGRGKMIAALRRLQSAHSERDLPGGLAAFGIDGGIRAGLARLFATHPPLADRIAALERA